MAPKDIFIMIVKDYFNNMINVPDSSEAWKEFWIIRYAMDVKLKESDQKHVLFYQNIMVALVKEGVCPGRNLGIPGITFLDYESIKEIMNSCYKMIMGKLDPKAILEKFKNSFAVDMVNTCKMVVS